jgi:hypothetical protein
MKHQVLSSVSAGLILSGGIAANAVAQSAPAPHATPPYQLSVFASAPRGSSAPDSIAVLRDHVFVGFGDGNAPDGSDGKSTQIVEYSLDGKVEYTYTVKGHNDGLKKARAAIESGIRTNPRR